MACSPYKCICCNPVIKCLELITCKIFSLMTIPYNPLDYMFTVHCPFGQFRRKKSQRRTIPPCISPCRRSCKAPSKRVSWTGGSPTRDEFKADVRDGSINQRNYDKLRYSLVVIYRLYRLHIMTFLYVYRLYTIPSGND